MRAGWGRVLAAACLAAVLCSAAPANAQRHPTYRSPAFKGKAVAPKVTPAPPPEPVTLAEDGLHPDALVDEAGTAHIVWATGRGDEADAAVYCRLKRGATACDTSQVLLPEKTYGQFDSPAYDIDNGGPEILRVGEQLVVLSYRYPTGFDRPDGAGSGGVIQWTSDDGGNTWTGGVLAARSMAIAGSLAEKKSIPPSAGTFPTTGGLFVGLVVGVIVIIGGLTFFPALALGPIVEHFAMTAGTLFSAN